MEAATTNSEPLLNSLFENHLNDDEQTRRKSSVGHHSTLPHEMVKVKSIAAGHISREMRRLSAQQEKIHLEENKVSEGDEGTPSEPQEDEAKLRVIPCLPAVAASIRRKAKAVDASRSSDISSIGCSSLSRSHSCACSRGPYRAVRKLITGNISCCRSLLQLWWIAILSFGMVTIVGRVGCILNIDKFTMGLVVVAIGTKHSGKSFLKLLSAGTLLSQCKFFNLVCNLKPVFHSSISPPLAKNFRDQKL